MKENTTTPEGQTVYELGFLILPSIAEDKLSAVTDKLEALVKSFGGTKIDGEAPMKIDLSYTMTKVVGASRYVVNDAYLGWMKFEAEPAGMPALKAALDLSDELVRYLLIKAPRETTFTFADAQAALMEDAADKPETPEAPAVTPVEAVVE
jgi:ribosomal protein S6